MDIPDCYILCNHFPWTFIPLKKAQKYGRKDGASGGDRTYYAFGNVIAAQVSETTDTAVTVTTSQGSRDNIQELRSNRAQFSFVQSDVMAYAYEGTNGFIAPVENFSAVCAMYEDSGH